jgi:hypothetical protein
MAGRSRAIALDDVGTSQTVTPEKIQLIGILTVCREFDRAPRQHRDALAIAGKWTIEGSFASPAPPQRSSRLPVTAQDRVLTTAMPVTEIPAAGSAFPSSAAILEASLHRRWPGVG